MGLPKNQFLFPHSFDIFLGSCIFLGECQAHQSIGGWGSKIKRNGEGNYFPSLLILFMNLYDWKIWCSVMGGAKDLSGFEIGNLVVFRGHNFFQYCFSHVIQNYNALFITAMQASFAILEPPTLRCSLLGWFFHYFFVNTSQAYNNGRQKCLNNVGFAICNTCFIPIKHWKGGRGSLQSTPDLKWNTSLSLNFTVKKILRLRFWINHEIYYSQK